MSKTIATGPGDALHALAQRDCRIVLRALGPRGDRHAGIHRARKTIRRLRAVLALGAARFGADGDAIDRRLQRLAAGLSALRDAQAVTDTADTLACGGDAAQWHRLARRLARRRDLLLRQALADDPGFDRRREPLRRAAAAIDALPWHALRPGDVRKALARGERRVAKARKQAMREPTPQQLHRWRRRVRKLRLQVDAARAPDAVAPTLSATLARKPGKQARALKKLADRLGRYQDLRILRRALKELPDTAATPALRARLRREMKQTKP
ncbi:CHAD domain-containing protein [Luteimonas salinilitoris]